MEEKDLQKLIETSNAKLDQFNEMLEKGAKSSAEIEAKHKELSEIVLKLSKESGEASKKLEDQLDAMDKKMQTALQNTPQGQKTFADQMKEMFTSDKYKAACAQKGVPVDFDIKANEITTSTFTETNGPVIQRMYEPGIVSAPQRPTPVWDLISKGTTTSDFVITTERSSQTIGASATHVAEAGAFPQSYAAWTTYVWGVNKIAEHIKVAQEKLEDWEYVRGEVMDMLMTNIPHVREGKLLTGYNATQVWNGIINTTAQVAKDFAKPTGFDSVTFANRFDVLRAAILQVEVGNSASLENKMGFFPNAILLHPADAANMEIVKASDGQYVLPPFTAQGGLVVRGIRVIPTLYMTAGKFLVGDFTAAKAWVNRTLQVRMWDQNSTDPIYDLVTFTASHRLAFGIGATKAYGFVYGDFDDAITLISA